MPQTIRMFWGPFRGRRQFNFNWDAIDSESTVIVTASEYSADFTLTEAFGQKSDPRVVGAATITVDNIAPHSPPFDANPGVTFVVTVDHGTPVLVVTDITVLDERPVEVQYSADAPPPVVLP
jgi:hypothetical protein